MKAKVQFKDNDNLVNLSDNFLFQINQFSKGKPIKPNSFGVLADFLVENMNKPSVNLTRIFLKALETHPAYQHPNSRRRREVYLRSATAYCLNKILNLGTYEIALLLNKDRSTIFLILQSFEENLRFNDMLLGYFQSYLSFLITQLKSQMKFDYRYLLLKLTVATEVDEVLDVVQKIKGIIESQKK